MESSWKGYLTVRQSMKMSDLNLIDRQTTLLMCVQDGSPKKHFPFELPKWQPEPDILMLNVVNRSEVSDRLDEAHEDGVVLNRCPIRVQCKSLDGYVRLNKLRRTLAASDQVC